MSVARGVRSGALLRPRALGVHVDRSAGPEAVARWQRALAVPAPAGAVTRTLVAAADGSLADAAQAGGWQRAGWEAAAGLDLMVLVAGPEAIADLLPRAAQAGAQVVVAATGAAPPPSAELLRERARACGLRLLGAGDGGLVLPESGIDALGLAAPAPAGRLAVVTPSAGIAAAVCAWARARAARRPGLGLSRVVALGAPADLGVAEVLQVLATDPRTNAVLLHLDRIDDGRALLAAARTLARIKPVTVLWAAPGDLVPGRSEGEGSAAGRRAEGGAGGSATGTGDARRDRDAADRDAADRDAAAARAAVLARAGLVQAHDWEEWLDTGAILSGDGLRRSGGLVVVSNDPYLAATAVQEAKRHRVLVAPSRASPERPGNAQGPAPGNWIPATDESIAAVLRALRDDPAVAGACVAWRLDAATEWSTLAPPLAEGARGAGLAVALAAFGAPPDPAADPVAALAAASVDVYDGIARAVRAFTVLDAHRRRLQGLRQVPLSRREQLLAQGAKESGADAAAGLRTADEAESPAFLRAYASLWRAIQAGAAPTVAERQALLEVFGLRTGAAGSAVDGGGWLPLQLSIVDDRDFGRLVRLDAAGAVRYLVPPLNEVLAAEAIDAAATQLHRATGRPLPRAALADALLRLSQLAVEWPEVVALHAQALGLDPAGEALVLEAREVRVAAPGRAGGHLSVHPYPRELEGRLALKDGRQVLVRPIRVEDIGPYRQMLDRIGKDELFLRFCNQYGDLLQAIPNDLLANLVHLDYSRDVTLVALAPEADGRAAMVGVVDAFVSTSGEQAEFSILVRSDMAGTGLGKALMLRIAEVCRAREVERLYGLILKRNARMIGLCRHLGFVRVEDEDDEDMVRYELALR